MKNYIRRRSVLNTILPVALVSFAFPSRASAQQQPHMQAALDALRLARRELDQASEDKGGHRVKAIGLVNQAIAEVEKGIQFDRRN
jgi:hypothetical protein